jgi:hypothetical protein
MSNPAVHLRPKGPDTPSHPTRTRSSCEPTRLVLHCRADSVTRFGGTDGNYHYNDTWSFDTTTNQWTELSCIGYIPVPREGHAAAIVDGTIYIFGGRDVNGKDLGDLAAFRITSASVTHREAGASVGG